MPPTPVRPWVDPPLTYGYSFTMTSGARFTKIVDFPPGIDADGQFLIRANGSTVGTFGVGQTVDFVLLTGGAAVSFEVLGIGPLIDGSNSDVFPIQLEFDTPAPSFNMVPIESVPATAICVGTAGTCPCGNVGSASNGCSNSTFTGGGNLAASGLSSVADDTLVLAATGIPGPGLFFQANTLLGSPLTFGDGLLCAGLGIVRLGVVFPTGGSAAYPGGLTPNPIHIAGAPIVSGSVCHYQCWYRDSATYCTTDTSNLTQGLTVTWTP